VSLRLVLADDHYLVREGLRRLLETQPDLEIVAACGDLDELLEAVDAEHPDVVVTDIRMPPTGVDEGIRAAERLRETHPDVGVVVLSQYSQPAYALTLLESGSERRAYLLKERVDDLEQLVGAIRTVAAGEAVLHPELTRRLLDRFVRGPAPQGVPERLRSLTEREREVLTLVARGHTNAEIAESLFLSEATVKTHVVHVAAKLQLRDRVHAVVTAYECGLVHAGE
jgi:DNA-binding NarL/FixJ family response regulator